MYLIKEDMVLVLIPVTIVLANIMQLAYMKDLKFSETKKKLKPNTQLNLNRITKILL